jgi:hypothetical protein
MSRATLTRFIVGLAVTAGAAGAADATPAWAGSYTVSACSPFTTASPWTEVDTFPAGITAGNMCGGPAVGPLGGGNDGALYAEDNAESAGTSIPNGAQAGWAFAAPAGTVVTSISYYRDLEIHPTSDDFVTGLFEANGTPLETCQGTFQNSYTCSVPNNQAPANFSGLAAGGLFFGVKCELQPSEEHCLSGSPGHHLATADMYSAVVTLTEESSPIVSGESGPLWAGGVVSGTVPLSFQATDPSGIEGLTARDSGAVGASAQESCDFTQAVPCPELEPAQVNVETTRFPDGHAELSLVVTDAAGNTTVVTSPPVIIDNDGPAAPASLTASAAGAGSDVVNLAWSDPANPPEPVASAFVQLCQATCAPAVVVSGAGAGQVTAPGPGSYTVRLWLVDSAGKGGPQNAVTTAVVVPSPPTSMGGKGGEGANVHPLRIGEQVHGSRLAVTVDVPAGEHGPVSVHLDLPRGKRLVFVAKREVRPSRGVARVAFVLSNGLLREARLVLSASAAGVRSAHVAVTLPRGH